MLRGKDFGPGLHSQEVHNTDQHFTFLRDETTTARPIFHRA